MSWLVSNWRLKLLALALTLSLLGAVAFSENPIAFATLPAKVDYAGLREGVVILNPVPTVNVQVSGLADAVKALKPENLEVRADVSKLAAGTDTTVTARVIVLVPNVAPTSSTVPLRVMTDSIQVRSLDIEVRTPNVAPGWSVDTDPKKTHSECQPDPANPCKVTLTGPTTLVQDVKAFVLVQNQINNTIRFPNQTVRFERNGQPVDFTNPKLATQPQVGWDPATVTVQVTANSASAKRQVAVNVPVTGRPACGYGVTGLTISPGNGVVTISGPADVVAGRDSVPVDGIDISNANGNVSRTLPIRVADPVTAAPSSVLVTVAIQKQLDCNPPTPTPTPSPTQTR